MLLPERLNPRSKGQLALKKGLANAPTRFLAQEDAATLDDIIAPYVGKEPSLATPDDVIENVKDIIAERFAYDETARTMVRRIHVRRRVFRRGDQVENQRRPLAFRGQIGAGQGGFEGRTSASSFGRRQEDRPCQADRCSCSASPNAQASLCGESRVSGFPLISEAIDESWVRLLQPIAERDIKNACATKRRLGHRRYPAGSAKSNSRWKARRNRASPAASPTKKNFAVVACNDKGRLYGAALEKKIPLDKPVVSERLRQFVLRYRPERILVPTTKRRACRSDYTKSLEGIAVHPRLCASRGPKELPISHCPRG